MLSATAGGHDGTHMVSAVASVAISNPAHPCYKREYVIGNGRNTWYVDLEADSYAVALPAEPLAIKPLSGIRCGGGRLVLASNVATLNWDADAGVFDLSAPLAVGGQLTALTSSCYIHGELLAGVVSGYQYIDLEGRSSIEAVGVGVSAAQFTPGAGTAVLVVCKAAADPASYAVGDGFSVTVSAAYGRSAVAGGSLVLAAAGWVQVYCVSNSGTYSNLNVQIWWE